MGYSVQPTGKNVLIMLSLTLGWMVAMRFLTAPLNSATIVAFELAGTTEVAQQMIASFTPIVLQRMRWSIYLDFVFLIFYSGTLFLMLRWLGGKIQTLWVQKAVYLISWLMWVAALADVVENIAMLVSLDQLNNWAVVVSYWFAILKFAGIMLGISCLVTVGAGRLLVRSM